MANKWVYMFSEGDMTMRNLLGGKGANLAEMTTIGLPVPQGFTITTEACTQYYEDGRGENTANVGKLIYSNTWYYAAAVAEEEAQRIAACGSVSLRLTKGVTDDIAAAVHSVGPAENGRCVVVLSCREYLAETTQLRHQTAQIVLHSYTGLRLPSVCLRQSDDGKLGVYCVQGSFPQFKPVEMVYQGDDYVLVSVPQNTEGLSTLRPGDEVIMTGVTLDGTQILKED